MPFRTNQPQYPGGAFTQRFSEKERLEREQGIGQQFAQGIGAGVAGGIQQRQQQQAFEQKSQYQMALDVIKDRFKISQPLKNGKPMTFAEELQMMNNMASGNYKPNPDITWDFRKTDETVVMSVTEENADKLSLHLGYSVMPGTSITLSGKNWRAYTRSAITTTKADTQTQIQKDRLEGQKEMLRLKGEQWVKQHNMRETTSSGIINAAVRYFTSQLKDKGISKLSITDKEELFAGILDQFSNGAIQYQALLRDDPKTSSKIKSFLSGGGWSAAPILEKDNADKPPFKGTTKGEVATKGNKTYTWDGAKWQ